MVPSWFPFRRIRFGHRGDLKGQARVNVQPRHQRIALVLKEMTPQIHLLRAKYLIEEGRVVGEA